MYLIIALFSGDGVYRFAIRSLDLVLRVVLWWHAAI
jgi:hypothetical protein